MKNILLLITTVCFCFSFMKDEIAFNCNSKCTKIELPYFNNLYRVNFDLYRSEQPTKEGIQELEKYGIQSILNVRNILNDKKELKGSNINGEKYRINTWTITKNEVIQAIKLIQKLPKPVLLHCKHGSDRTGCIVAVYKMIYCNMPKEKAIDEFKNGGYGYHEKAFPNILKLLNAIDIDEIRAELAVE